LQVELGGASRSSNDSLRQAMLGLCEREYTGNGEVLGESLYVHRG